MKTPNKPILFIHKLKADANGQLPELIELCQVGEWKTPWHGDFQLTRADLEEAVRNFNAGVYRVQGTEPLPGTLDHMGGAATFRIHEIFLDGDALMARVTWTELGKEKVLRDEYRYISMEYNHRGLPLENPEKAGEFWVNVLTGATLTNDPLFKKLKPVMASARTGSDKSNQGESMKLEELRAKDPSTLTDEQKAFLADNKADLTDEERTKFGLTDDDQAGNGDSGDDTGDGGDANDGDTGDQDDTSGSGSSNSGDGDGDGSDDLSASAKPVTITSKQLAQLQADAQAGREAKLQLDREHITQQLNAHVAKGRIKSDQVKEATAILMAAAPALRKRIEGLLASLPENRMITGGEQGSGGTDAKDTKAAQLEASAMQMAAKENISFGEALRKVTAKNPELANYSEEDK